MPEAPQDNQPSPESQPSVEIVPLTPVQQLLILLKASTTDKERQLRYPIFEDFVTYVGRLRYEENRFVSDANHGEEFKRLLIKLNSKKHHDFFYQIMSFLYRHGTPGRDNYIHYDIVFSEIRAWLIPTEEESKQRKPINLSGFFIGSGMITIGTIALWLGANYVKVNFIDKPTNLTPRSHEPIKDSPREENIKQLNLYSWSLHDLILAKDREQRYLVALTSQRNREFDPNIDKTQQTKNAIDNLDKQIAENVNAAKDFIKKNYGYDGSQKYEQPGTLKYYKTANDRENQAYNTLLGYLGHPLAQPIVKPSTDISETNGILRDIKHNPLPYGFGGLVLAALFYGAVTSKDTKK